MISVIIPTVLHTELVKQCVTSFINTVHQLAYEIIIVDDGSTAWIQQDLQAWSDLLPQVRFIGKTANEGFSKTVNCGIQHAQGDYVLIVNNDVVFFEPGWLQHMLVAMNSSPDIGIVGARLLYPNLTIQHGGVVPTQKGHFDHRYRGQEAHYPPAMLIEDVNAVTGALMLVRKHIFSQIGLLSEEFFIAFEDIDLCYRAKQHGIRVIYCGTASAIHVEGATRGTTKANKNPYWRQKEMEARKKFWIKWGGKIIQ
ncbi:glycosyltransferase family 2 protein [Paenibacillus alvei]|uniref:Glycosyltransferase family 2 protein n=1 Tax=Paenibacillus alvei TaxID=44250 RepID=A0AAP6ZWU0_PAEAL|nr:glycosyltransferase family 2 protein [Paenibacillus alvei]NEZ43531.1 glycosyltransferase [Paenibacillus alvei]NOJ70370.1 glycosyltransferase family 2 protein [Paenibacillus alvei]